MPKPSRSILSFANVVSVLALFVALGGSSYAAMKIGSDEIADNSVRGRDIHKDSVRGTDIRNNDVKGRDVRDNTLTGDDLKESTLGSVPRAEDALTLAGKPASAFLGSGRQTRTGLIKLAHGETKTVASSGPFTWKAACSDDGGGNTGLTVTAESTEAGSFAGDFGGGGQPVSPGSPATMFERVDDRVRLHDRVPAKRRRAQRGGPHRHRIRRPTGRRSGLRGQRRALALNLAVVPAEEREQVPVAVQRGELPRTEVRRIHATARDVVEHPLGLQFGEQRVDI